MGTRSPFGLNASATIVTTADRVTISIGMIAWMSVIEYMI
jgi:hypothetical protein